MQSYVLFLVPIRIKGNISAILRDYQDAFAHVLPTNSDAWASEQRADRFQTALPRSVSNPV